MNKPQSKNNENSNESASLSPLSFNKSSNDPTSKKVPMRKTKISVSNKENERRQTFNVSKADTTSRNLFGTTSNSNKRNSKEAAPTQPKPFLKRTSLSQTIPSKHIFFYD